MNSESHDEQRPSELTSVPAAEVPAVIREYLDDGATRITVRVAAGGRCTVKAEYGGGAR